MTKKEILNGMSEEEFYRLYPTKDAWEKANKMKLGGLSGAPHNGQPTADQFFNYGSHANDKLNIPMSNPFFLKQGGTYYGGPIRPYQLGGYKSDFPEGLYNYALKQREELLKGDPKLWSEDPDMLLPTGELNYCIDCMGNEDVYKNPQNVKDIVRLIEEGYSTGTHYFKPQFEAALKELNIEKPVFGSKANKSTANKRYGGYMKQGGTYYNGDVTEFCWGGGLPGGPNEMPEMLHGGYHSPMNYGSFPATEWGGALDPSNMDSYPMMEGGGDPFIFRKLQAGKTELPYMTDKDTGLDPGLKMRSTGFNYRKLQPGKPNFPFMNVKDPGYNQSGFNFRQLPAEKPVMSDMNIQDAPMSRPGFNYRNLPAQNPNMPFMNTPDTKLADIIKSASRSMKKKGGKTTTQGGNQNFLENRRIAFDDALKNNVYNAFIQEEEKAAMQALNPYATGMEDMNEPYQAKKGIQHPNLDKHKKENPELYGNGDVPVNFGKFLPDLFPSGRDYSAYIPGEMRSNYYMSNEDYARMVDLNKRLGDKTFELTGFKGTPEYGPMARLLGKTGRRMFGPKAVTYEFTGRGSKQVPIKDTELNLPGFQDKYDKPEAPWIGYHGAWQDANQNTLPNYLERNTSFFEGAKPSIPRADNEPTPMSDRQQQVLDYMNKSLTPSRKSDENIQLDPSKLRTTTDQATQQKIEDLNKRLNNKKYGGLNTYQGGGPQIGYQQYQELMNAYNAANAATGSDKGDKTLAFQRLYHKYLPENARQLIQSRGSATAMGKTLGAGNEFSLESNEDRKFGKTTKAYGQSLQDMASMFKPQDQTNPLTPGQPNMPYMDMQDPGINFPSTQPQPGFQFNKLAGDAPTMDDMNVADSGMGNFKYTAPTANLASSSSTTPKTQVNNLTADKPSMGNVSSTDPFLNSLSGMSDADKKKAIVDRAKNFPTGKLTPDKPELKDLTETELGPEEKLGAKIKRKTKGIGKTIAKYAPGIANKWASLLEDQPEIDPMQNQPIVLGNRGDYDINSGNFRPDQQVPVQFPGGYGAYRTKFGGALPQALSGLEVKMQPGLYGTNGNRQFTLPTQVDSQKFSQQPVSVRGSLTAVPRDQANLEAEGGETALVNIDGFPAHFKISGKRHSQGGVPLDLPDNSFIYSDTASMKIKDPNILAQFGMAPKKGGYTPAEIAKKYDINKYRKILADPNSEDLERKTAESMIANNNMKLAKLAMAQESLKGFPQGIPVVAMPYMIANDIDPAMYAPTQAQEEQPDEDMGVQRYGGNIIAQYPTMRYGGLPIAQNGDQVNSDPYGLKELKKQQAERNKILEREKAVKEREKQESLLNSELSYLRNQVDQRRHTLKKALDYDKKLALKETDPNIASSYNDRLISTVEELSALDNLSKKLNTPGHQISEKDFAFTNEEGNPIAISKGLRSVFDEYAKKPYKIPGQVDWMKGKNLKGVVQDINKFTGTPDTKMSYSQFSQDFPVYEKPAVVQNVEVKKKPAATKTAKGSSKPKKDWSKYEIKE